MSLLWAICGVGRGVGKTHLALALCEVLPVSIYAKCGHGAVQADKPMNFFSDQAGLASFIDSALESNEHVVVESNRLARSATADITIFLDAPRHANAREDAGRLAAAADVRVARGHSLKTWKTYLRTKLDSASLCDAVCDALARQKRHVYGAGLGVRTKIWFEQTDQHTFGVGLARLLEQVDRTGTLSNAAREASISYRHAWDMVAQAEAHLGKKLLIRLSGGRGGGGSGLSDEGRRLLGIFTQLNSKVARFANKEFARLCAKEGRHD